MGKLQDTLQAMSMDPEIKAEVQQAQQQKAKATPTPQVDFTPLLKKKKKVSGMSVALVTAIQQIYAQEQQKQQQGSNGQAPQVALNSGWGGAGR
jgi:hypothetical protein